VAGVIYIKYEVFDCLSGVNRRPSSGNLGQQDWGKLYKVWTFNVIMVGSCYYGHLWKWISMTYIAR